MIEKSLLEKAFGDVFIQAARQTRFIRDVEIAGLDFRVISSQDHGGSANWRMTIDSDRWRVTLTMNHSLSRVFRSGSQMIDEVLYVRGDRAEIIEDLTAMRLALS